MKRAISTEKRSGNAADLHAVSRCMMVIRALSESRQGLLVSDLVRDLGLEKSAVSRILSTLENAGYVTRDEETSLNKLSLEFVCLSLRQLDSRSFQDLCFPILNDLSIKTGELVHLAIVDGDTMRYVAKAEQSHLLQVLSLVGTEAPLHATTAGKVWLASLPTERALKVVLSHGMKRFSDKTVTDIQTLQAQLPRIRKQGFALVEDEFLPGANGVGVPVFADKEEKTVIGAITVSGPSIRLPKDVMLSYVPALKETAMKIQVANAVPLTFMIEGLAASAPPRQTAFTV